MNLGCRHTWVRVMVSIQNRVRYSGVVWRAKLKRNLVNNTILGF